MREKKKGLTKEAIKEFNESRKGLEVDVMHEVLSSRRTAWIVAVAACVVAVVAIGNATYVNYRYSQPLPPFLLTLNPATKEVSQVKLTRDEATYGDEIDKYFLTQYVIHRESYDFYSL